MHFPALCRVVLRLSRAGCWHHQSLCRAGLRSCRAGHVAAPEPVRARAAAEQGRALRLPRLEMSERLHMAAVHIRDNGNAGMALRRRATFGLKRLYTQCGCQQGGRGLFTGEVAFPEACPSALPGKPPSQLWSGRGLPERMHAGMCGGPAAK